MSAKGYWRSAGSVMLAVVLGAGLFLRLAPAQPKSAIQNARTFVAFLQAHQLEEAYKLTTQGSGMGRSFAEFQKVVERQWPNGPVASVRLVSVHPFQSYGNRLRRWINGREVEMPELSVQFLVTGVPFEVREKYVSGGHWKVSYLQSHAG